jgi:hypothetical protein
LLRNVTAMTADDTHCEVRHSKSWELLLSSWPRRHNPLDIKTSFHYVLMMRTTLTIETDVARELDILQRSKKQSLKQVINEVLRAGLLQLKSPPKKARYKIKPVDLGKPKVASLDNIADVLALAEGENHK